MGSLECESGAKVEIHHTLSDRHKGKRRRLRVGDVVRAKRGYRGKHATVVWNFHEPGVTYWGIRLRFPHKTIYTYRRRDELTLIKRPVEDK
jgi:hypothetical protein